MSDQSSQQSESQVEVQSLSESKLVEGGILIPPSQPDQPTNNPGFKIEMFQHYYQYRITLPHAEFPRLQAIFNKHSKLWCAAFHYPHPDGDDGEHEKKEHFHVCFVDMPENKATVMRRELCKEFERQGNPLHSGKNRSNFATSYFQYCGHQPDCEYKHWGPYWEHVMSMSPSWVDLKKKPVVSLAKIEKKSYPTMTYYNCIRQALRWREEHKIKSSDLRVVCEHMTRVGKWQPDPKIMREGLSHMHFKLFTFHCNEQQGVTPNWWDPHTI